MDEDAGNRRMEIDLGPCHIVLGGGPSSRERGTAAPPPSFRPLFFLATFAHLSYC